MCFEKNTMYIAEILIRKYYFKMPKILTGS